MDFYLLLEIYESHRVLCSYYQCFIRSCYNCNDVVYVSVIIADGGVLFNVYVIYIMISYHLLGYACAF